MTPLLRGSLLALALVCRLDAAAQTSGRSASTVHCADEAPLTAALADELALDSLRAYLEQSNVVTGYFGDEGSVLQTLPPAEQSAPVELRFAIENFRYYKKTIDAPDGCDDSTWTLAHVSVRIGNGLLSFEADGRLWKNRHGPSAHFYADADLAAAKGSYRPNLDPSRLQVGTISVSLDVAPGHLRGDVNSAVAYFRDEAQLQRYRQGAWHDYAERTVLFHFNLSRDSCSDAELPFALDDGIEQLDRQSAAQWRTRAIGLIGAKATVDAVWSDGRETEVAVELGEPIVGTACLGGSFYPARVSELQLRIPLAGRLRSIDARLDMPLDELVVGIDGQAVVRATVRNRPSARDTRAASEEQLFARLSYDFERDPASLDGVVEHFAGTASGKNERVECLAFPRGGQADVSVCRYRPPIP